MKNFLRNRHRRERRRAVGRSSESGPANLVEDSQPVLKVRCKRARTRQNPSLTPSASRRGAGLTFCQAFVRPPGAEHLVLGHSRRLAPLCGPQRQGRGGGQGGERPEPVSIKERTPAPTKPVNTPPGRCRQPDALLAFLEGLVAMPKLSARSPCPMGRLEQNSVQFRCSAH